ncbi:MAG: DNA alkylation repair protein [Candidatus Edwardsbacteria bacterium]|nr:DNA alkylation repair protein [Candidatus Edwardsbacteria bacterium]MBU1577459.1 DNA alkylation repair protein [Candidatus Edwardsbacteria bacterium]MBU2464178.1 DNA alkylation repair protein [Candidatus Edwardsbacteria bacterium]MBU2593026.1 DNA alkylation repair protein [Candidatus Edwardsbacteria bacterium]
METVKRDKYLKSIRRDLAISSDEKYRCAIQVFFKEGIKLYGVRTPLVRKISQKYYAAIKDRPKNDIFKLCDQLLESGLSEERTIAFDWAYRLRKRYQPGDFARFEKWLKKYAPDWGGVDDLCTHALGYFLFNHPEFINNVRAWTKSPKWWMRRASAVALIYGLRRGVFLKDAFKTADILLLDKEDLVQKGYGWMLKVAGDRHQKEIFDYVIKNKKKMPRTALRYAIEKFPEALRQKALSK